MNWQLPDTRQSTRAAHRFLDNDSISHEATLNTLSLRTQDASRRAYYRCIESSWWKY